MGFRRAAVGLLPERRIMNHQLGRSRCPSWEVLECYGVLATTATRFRPHLNPTERAFEKYGLEESSSTWSLHNFLPKCFPSLHTQAQLDRPSSGETRYPRGLHAFYNGRSGVGAGRRCSLLSKSGVDPGRCGRGKNQ